MLTRHRRLCRPPLRDFSNQQAQAQAQAQPNLLPAPTICTIAPHSRHSFPSSSASPDAFRPERTDPSPPSPAAPQAALKDLNYMEVDSSVVSTPRVKVLEQQTSPSSKGSLVTYSRRKPPSYVSMSCPPPANHQCHRRDRRGADDDWNNTSRIKRGFSAMIFDGEDISMQVAASKKMRRMSLPNMPKWLPKDFVSEQKCHFAEVDAFQLIEEEGELSEEED